MARAHVKNVADFERQNPGRPAAYVASAHVNANRGLCAALGAHGQTAEAIRLGEQTFAVSLQKLGPAHQETLNLLGLLGGWQSDMGNHVEALRLGKQAFESTQQAFGPDHENTLVAQSNLSVQYSSLGDYESAIELARASLAGQLRLHGENDLGTLSAMGNLGSHLGKSKNEGDHAEGLSYLQRATDISRRVFGIEHPDTVNRVYNLGQLLSRMGKHEEAAVLLEEAARYGAEALSKTSGTLKTYRETRRSAVHAELRAEESAEKNPGPGQLNSDPHTAQTKKEEGNAAFREGKLEVAACRYSEGIAADPLNHLIFSNRSNCWGKLGRWDLAVADAEACVRLSPAFAKGWVRLAEALLGVSDPSQAIFAAKRGLRCDDATASASKALRLCSKQAKTMISAAVSILRQNNVWRGSSPASAAADSAFRKVIRAAPDTTREPSASNGSWTEVHKQASIALREDHPDKCHLFTQRGQAWFYTGLKMERAMAQFTAAVREGFRWLMSDDGTSTAAEEREGLAYALWRRANVFMERKQWDKAEIELQICCELYRPNRGNHALALLQDIPRFKLPPEHDDAYTQMDFYNIGGSDSGAHAIWQAQEDSEQAAIVGVEELLESYGGQPEPEST